MYAFQQFHIEHLLYKGHRDFRKENVAYFLDYEKTMKLSSAVLNL